MDSAEGTLPQASELLKLKEEGNPYILERGTEVMVAVGYQPEGERGKDIFIGIFVINSDIQCMIERIITDPYWSGRPQATLVPRDLSEVLADPLINKAISEELGGLEITGIDLIVEIIV